jgi:uncharacterized protein YyaL (SSP411 family)
VPDVEMDGREVAAIQVRGVCLAERKRALVPVLALALSLALPVLAGGAGEGGGHERKPLPAASAIAVLPPDGGPEFNRLIHQKSPYLLQHARNPVDWYPWGAEATDRARREGKPIFLSVGYSTCHWCHVMEVESFETTEVADVLNSHFVPVKVDREERPDLDEIYMTATQLVTARGGWPNSVWLTPEGKPFHAGTYYPRPQFLDLARSVAATWSARRAELEARAEHVTRAIRQVLAGRPAGSAAPSPAPADLSRKLIDDARASLERLLDRKHGGMGGRPKFPPHQSLELLLAEHARGRPGPLPEFVTLTLDRMALGGFHDHLGGGFHRYSTDERWFLPHFEKMLYDNAMLAASYAAAAAATGREDYRRVARGAYDWVLREMTGPEGGFHSALDADSEGEEGRFYLWRRSEILSIVGAADGALVCEAYNATEDGNYRDEASGHSPGTNILYLEAGVDDLARAKGIPPDQLHARLARARGELLARRQRRVWPQKDDKVIVAWNGLMIGSLARGGQLLAEPRYVQAAARAATFLLEKLTRDGRLLHVYREGPGAIPGYLDDHAMLARGLLDLHEATGDARWLREAQQLADRMLDRFRDEADGGFFYSSVDHEALLARSKDPSDGAIPSGNGVAAQVLARLARLTGDMRYRDFARRTLESSSELMSRASLGAQSLLLALSLYLDLPARARERSARERSERPSGPGSQPARPEAAPTVGPASPGLPSPAAVAEARATPITVHAFLDRRAAKPGERISVSFRVTIDEGWHVNSAAPLQPHLVATRITAYDGAAAGAPAASFEGLAYPEGVKKTLGFDPAPVLVYEGEFRVKGTLVIAGNAAPGRIAVPVTVRAQPCDARRCLAPVTLPLVLPLEVAPPAAAGPAPAPRQR